MSGTRLMTGATWLTQQDRVEQKLKLYECQEAARLWSGSAGLWLNHWVRSLEYSSPPSMITLRAPVPRIALTSVCMPATRYPMPVHCPPRSQHRHPSLSLAPAARSGKGSLNRSKMTALFPLNARATEAQKGLA